MAMFVTNDLNEITLKVVVNILTVKLCFSLQDYGYVWIDGANAKQQNSILDYSVSLKQIKKDMEDLGKLVEIHINSINSGQPSIASKLNFVYKALNLPGKNNSNQPAQTGLSNDASFLSGEYTVQSGRTYRVFNVAKNHNKPPDHCYPVKGPKVWDNVSQQAFAATVAMRQVEKAMEAVPDTLSGQWNILKYMPVKMQKNNSLYGAISSARIHISQLPALIHSKISKVSGRYDLMDEIIKTI